MFNIGLTSILSGAWLIGGALILNTENFKSALIFKVIPFALGFTSLFFGLKYFGVL